MATAINPINGIWLKTHFFVKDGFLHAVSYMTVAGQPKVFEVSVDLARVDKLFSAYHKALHARVAGRAIAGDYAAIIGCDCVGEDCDCIDVEGECIGEDCFDEDEVGARKKRRRRRRKIRARGVAKLAKKIATSKVLKKVRKVADKVIKRTLAVAAVVYPPVGATALVAYTAASAALKAIEKGANTSNAAGKLAVHGKKIQNRTTSKLLAKATKKGLFKKFGKGKVVKAIKKIADKTVLKKLTKKASPQLLNQASRAIELGKKNRNAIVKTIAKAKAGDLPAVKKRQIYRLVAAHQERCRKLGVDPSGDTGLKVAVKDGKVKVSGCIGCQANSML